jgi:hypothetical protein
MCLEFLSSLISLGIVPILNFIILMHTILVVAIIPHTYFFMQSRMRPLRTPTSSALTSLYPLRLYVTRILDELHICTSPHERAALKCSCSKLAQWYSNAHVVNLSTSTREK